MFTISFNALKTFINRVCNALTNKLKTSDTCTKNEPCFLNRLTCRKCICLCCCCSLSAMCRFLLVFWLTVQATSGTFVFLSGVVAEERRHFINAKLTKEYVIMITRCETENQITSKKKEKTTIK